MERFAFGLRQSYGIGDKGPNKDVVTVISYGQVLVPAVFFAVVAAGGVYSAASPSSTVSELARQVKIGNSRLIVCGSEHKDVARRAAIECGLPSNNVLLLESDPQRKLASLDGHIDAYGKQRLPWKKITDPQELKDSLITILWSSGTTGLPKGVMLSHTNLVAETYIISLSGRQWAEQELAKGNELPAIEYRTLAHLPISHIAGLFGYLVLPMYSGGTVVWMRKYNWSDMLRYLKQYTITAFYTVPSIFLRISKSDEVNDHFKHLIAASTGAAPMDSKLQMSANARLGDGKEAMITQTWGLSETTGAVTAMPKGQTDTTGSISPILPSVELRMVDDDFNDVEPGQEGELLVRSPLVTNGYYDNPEATKSAFHDSWFCTGDIGVMRDGKFYIVDRKKVRCGQPHLLVRGLRALLTRVARNFSSTRAFKLRRRRSRVFFSLILISKRLQSWEFQRQTIQAQTYHEHTSLLRMAKSCRRKMLKHMCKSAWPTTSNYEVESCSWMRSPRTQSESTCDGN